MFIRWGQIFRKIVNFKIWSWKFMGKFKGKINGQGHMKQISQLIHTALVSCKLDHAFLKYKEFITWPWNFEVNVIAEFNENLSVNWVANLMATVAQTCGKYGTNMRIGIYFFNLRNVQITTKHSGHQLAYFFERTIIYLS